MKITKIYYHEAVCPICNRTIKGFYCPYCGLPIKIGDKYYKWHTRPEFSINSIYPICKKCDTPNPQNAEYCRNCGEKMYECKYNSKEWSLKSRNLDEVIHGGCANDFIQDGGIYKIIDKSCEGFYDERYSKNAVVVIMECCVKNDKGKIGGTCEALINLSAFDRSAIPYKKEADGFTVRDGEIVRADGTVVVSWKASKNAKVFMKDNVGRYFTTKLKKKVSVRAWDRAAEAYSKTELREQNVYTIDWV